MFNTSIIFFPSWWWWWWYGCYCSSSSLLFSWIWCKMIQDMLTQVIIKPWGMNFCHRWCLYHHPCCWWSYGWRTGNTLFFTEINPLSCSPEDMMISSFASPAATDGVLIFCSNQDMEKKYLEKKHRQDLSSIPVFTRSNACSFTTFPVHLLMSGNKPLTTTSA